MRNGRIRNGQITASSSYNSNQVAWYGRLGRVKSGRTIGGWCAKYKNTNQWLKVDFGRLMRVRKIATQGRQDAGYWVTSFYCSFSADNLHWAVYREKNSDKVRSWNICVPSTSKGISYFGPERTYFNEKKENIGVIYTLIDFR